MRAFKADQTRESRSRYARVGSSASHEIASVDSSGCRPEAQDGLMMLAVLNSTVCGHFSFGRLLIRPTA